MLSETRQQATHDVVAVLPGRADDMARLGILLGHDEPIVTVIGKYNHGKSRLLNELIGQEAFSVADKRETVKLADRVHQGVRWLDAPGLDADVGTEDDRHATHAAWLHADIRLFVHAGKEGELDAKELALLAELLEDSERTRRQTLFVLTQVDQLASESELQKVIGAITAQFPRIALNAVSSARHRKGVDEGKKLFIEKSGIPQLHSELDGALGRVPAARTYETSLLFTEVRDELAQLIREREASLEASRSLQRQQRKAFDQGLANVIKKVGSDIEVMLEGLGEDFASIPDTAKDAYASTAGKRERAYIQIAYSRGCIEIDSFLAGHGVIGLPSEQETAARALNTVMIAVMGVSVKFRKDLRRMFCTQAGREKLQGDFTRYYEISSDRKELAVRISETESSIDALQKASTSLNALEVMA
ncbi:GTPase Era [Caballeronia arvi]|uniref:GTPase Era n=1 Tax=Caballeronia arvi TaxID=1777135 RepID=A0A158L3A4_9BURK|nr:GTPase [Caballeronia arvi]SAL87443.1 GTPase Era [Caballeronia arvi]